MTIIVSLITLSLALLPIAIGLYVYKGRVQP